MLKDYFGINYDKILNQKYFVSNCDEHSMGASLFKYINIKIPDFVLEKKYKNIYVVGDYDRTCGISFKEKDSKLFNYKRPTFVIKDDDSIIVKCFPGIDYIYHYSSILATYFNLLSLDKKIIPFFPDSSIIKKQINSSNLQNVPCVETVILGYVEALQFLSHDTHWSGKDDFMWKRIDDKKILLGCKHSFWGDISGHIVAKLAEIGVKRIIYVGKLGTLKKDFIPNETIATGNSSVLFDGTVINWENIFEKYLNFKFIKEGVHYTLPSVIQETNSWVNTNYKLFHFVDPEIGHMANAAKINNIQFSYLHIISDNLSHKYEEDLSNERKNIVILKRKKLLKVIGHCISEI